MPSEATSAAAPSELTPFLWIAGFALCFALHLLVHPQARLFRDALRWLGKHPAPLLALMASFIVSKTWLLHSGNSRDIIVSMPAATPWADAFAACLGDAWKRLALLFHQAILPPPLLSGTWLGAPLQSIISATGQMWLACYLIASRVSTSADASGLRRAAARWRVIVGLALCHLPWWWVQGRSDSAFLRDVLLPEFLIFLAPLPLAAAAEDADFFNGGAHALQWWKKSGAQMLLFALTAYPLLLLLEYCLRLLPGVFPESRMLARVLLESVLASATQMWLFVTAALLLLRGAYVIPESADA